MYPLLIKPCKVDISRYCSGEENNGVVKSLNFLGLSPSLVSEFLSNVEGDFLPKNFKILAKKFRCNFKIVHCNEEDNIVSYVYNYKSKKLQDDKDITYCIGRIRYFYFVHERLTDQNITSTRYMHTLETKKYFKWKSIRHIPIIQEPLLNVLLFEQVPYEDTKKINEKKRIISYADTETITRPYHFPLILGRISNGKYTYVSRGYCPDWSHFKAFLDNFGPGYHIVYLHNLKFDWNVVKHNPYTRIRNVVKNDGIYYSVTLSYYKALIELRDSYKFVPHALSAFPKMFQLKGISKCEMILYELYTKENTIDNSISWQLWNREDSYQFVYDIVDMQCVKTQKISISKQYLILDSRILVPVEFKSMNIKYFTEERYYHLAHYNHYFALDCRILAEGMQTYEKRIKELFNASIHDYLTLPSLIHSTLTKNGCYDGVYQVSDGLRKFISSSIQGGRVCSKFNQKLQYLEGKSYVIDGRSLYPSAIHRLCFPTKEDCGRQSGLPVGEAILLKDWLKRNDYSHYIVKIRMLSIGKIQPLPFISIKRNKTRVYINEITDEMIKKGENIITVSKICLEDWEKFCLLKYEFIEGIAWKKVETSNIKIGEFVSELYNSRRKYLEDGNVSMAEVCKLALNSLYGKTIMKPKTTKIIVKDNDVAEEYFDEHIDQASLMEECANQSIISLNVDDINQSNLGHIGGLILDMSKRIMFEVINLCTELGIDAFYTDTDSLHIHFPDDSQNLVVLEEAFERIYGRKLLGTQLGQFGLELKVSGYSSDTLYSEKCIVLGKKVYMHRIVAPDGTRHDYCRMKGVNGYALEEFPDKLDLYSRLFNGETITFNLAYGNAATFDYTGNVTTKDVYLKKIRFA